VPFRYRFPLDVLIKSLKFSGDLAAAAEIAALMHRSDRRGDLPGLLVPVPLSDSRLRSRGFNQALELARHLGTGLGVEVSECCARRRDTAPQSSLAAAARRANVSDAFEADTGRVRGRHVAIVDDVVTTGHTVQAMARALRRAGARRIEVWAVARAIAHG
jgi:ComF family protein